MELVFSNELKDKLINDASKLGISLEECIEDIIVSISILNTELKIDKECIEFNDDYKYLDMKTYMGVLKNGFNVHAYIAIVPPVLGTRSGYISQQVFTGANLIIKNSLNSDFVSLFDKPLYIVDICRDSFPPASALNAYIMKKMGAYFISRYQESCEKVLGEEFYSLSKYDSCLKNNSQNNDNNYFTVDKTNKIIKFKPEKLTSNTDSLTNQPYWFVMKTYLAAQLGFLEGYTLDISDIEKNVGANKTIDTFKSYVKKLNSVLVKYNQKILFGAPGTGKSHTISNKVREFLKVSEDTKIEMITNVFRVTIHPDYNYSDFIGTIMPTVKKENADTIITYEFKDGALTLALKYAFLNPHIKTFLIIEEMSRGDIAGVFGDIFQLLDRDYFGVSEYFIDNDLIVKSLNKAGIAIDKVYIPSNLSILGTVNTSDQNVNVMDTAFKRRFDFEYMDVTPIRDSDTGELLNSFEFSLSGKTFEWNRFYMALNEFITEKLKLEEDKQLGQFFINIDKRSRNDNYIMSKIGNKLLNYLWEDVQKASLAEDFSIFTKNYISYSKINRDFFADKNIFSDEFIKIYDELNFIW
jgi:putative restriction enzyme